MVDEFLINGALGWTLSWFMLVVGLMIIYAHNLWVGDWRVLITIVGWAVLIKSVFMILLPSFLLGITKSLKNLSWIYAFGGVVWIVGGLVLSYYAFMA